VYYNSNQFVSQNASKTPSESQFKKISEGTCPQTSTSLDGCVHSTEVIQIPMHEISKLMQTPANFRGCLWPCCVVDWRIHCTTVPGLEAWGTWIHCCTHSAPF